MEKKSVFAAISILLFFSQAFLASAAPQTELLCKIKTRQDGAFLDVLVTDANRQPLQGTEVILTYNENSVSGTTAASGIAVFTLRAIPPRAYIFVESNGYECRRHIILQNRTNFVSLGKESEKPATALISFPVEAYVPLSAGIATLVFIAAAIILSRRHVKSR
jgi:hypothetical protein